MRKQYSLLTGVLLFVSHLSDTSAQETANHSQLIDAIGQEAVEADDAVGLSIGAARGASILHAAGYGLAHVELNVPAAAETVYRIGSISKEYTAAAIMLLVEDGKLDLGDPLRDHLPDYPELAEAVTIRHLLRHTSGIQDFTRLPTYRRDRQPDVSQDEVLAQLQDVPLDFSPGEKFSYCNSGYFLLGLIIERASGVKYREFVKERLFPAASLEHTYCDDPFRIIPNQAAGYTRWGGQLRNAPYVSLNQTLGAGNLAATVEDLLVWQRKLVTGEILNDESTDLLLTPGDLPGEETSDYGFGVRIQKWNGQRVIRHAGGISGFRGEVAYLPDSELAIAVLSNCDRTNTLRIAKRIAAQILAADDEP